MIYLQAPIVIFVYNRFNHVRKLIESLERNPEAINSKLYIFSDGPKNFEVESQVKKVREYIESVPKRHIFKDVKIIKSDKNKGLATSIIEGVSYVMNIHGCAIVIEDDNIVAPDFLDYMNRALEFYRNDSRIWAISGFSRNISFPINYKHDIYIMQRISSYAWASWENRWNKTEWDIKEYPEFLWDRKRRMQFDQCGEDRSLMLDSQVCGNISSWAIRFEYSMFKNDMYSVLPCVSRSMCTGNDGSGTHSRKETHVYDTILSNGEYKAIFEHLEQDERIRQEFIKPYKKNFKRKLLKNIDYVLQYYTRRKN